MYRIDFPGALAPGFENVQRNQFGQMAAINRSRLRNG
jgi:hypothetical protein